VLALASSSQRLPTADQPLLKNHTPEVDRAKIGVSYSGGGPRFVLELGAARALIKSGVVPAAIAGVSAGAVAAASHVVDPRGARGIDVLAQIVPQRLSTKGLGLTMEGLIERAIRYRFKLRSFGDNSVVRDIARAFFAEMIGDERPVLGLFAPPRYPRLLVGASDWVTQDAFWFEGDALVEDALLASSAIPGLFPWCHHQSPAGHAVLIDGGVISNQPLSRLVIEGCGTIFACGFSSPPRIAYEPSNALHNILDSIQMTMHQCSHLEEDYVRLKLGDNGDVHRLTIDRSLPSQDYDFTPALINELIDDADHQVSAQLSALGYSA
jgi:predicted acylesterase/phospholipase RssA